MLDRPCRRRGRPLQASLQAEASCPKFRPCRMLEVWARSGGSLRRPWLYPFHGQTNPCVCV